MAKLTLQNITGSYASVAKLNANFTAIEEALENTLSRDGTTPNALEADIDANSHTFINLPDAVDITSPITLKQMYAYLNALGAGTVALQRDAATATDGQTVFNLNLNYIPSTNNIFVFRNGSKLRITSDYVETDTNTITLTVGANEGDEFEFFVNTTTTSEVTTASAVTIVDAGGKYTSGNVEDVLQEAATALYYKHGATGSVATSVQDKLREVISVVDFGADPTGVADSTTAIEAAAQSLTGNQTLYFPDGTYLISYIWTPKTDSDVVNGIGRGRGVCYFNNVPNIRLYGPRATIKCVDHDIATYGGFTFAWVTKSPGFTIEGFTFDMTFTGYNTSASYYPMCGGVNAYDKYAGTGTQDALCSQFAARDLIFKLYHPNGAFSITSAPYGGDNNNGHKLISVFASGDAGATNYSEQSRNLLIQNIRFLKGHNGYGCWGVAYNNAVFRDITADAWVAASYTIS